MGLSHGVLREQDDRGTETRLLWSWVSKRDEGGMELGWLGTKKMREQRGTWDKAVGRKEMREK